MYQLFLVHIGRNLMRWSGCKSVAQIYCIASYCDVCIFLGQNHKYPPGISLHPKCLSYKRTYRKVASRSTCYYSENQKSCIFKSQLLTCHTFFRNKTFMFVKIDDWNFVRFHEILNHKDAENFSFLSWRTKKFCSKKKCGIILWHVTNWI